MGRFIAIRFFQSLIALWALSVIIFLLVRLTGDPTITLLPADARPEVIENLRHTLGLDQPLFVQYFIFARDFATGDFGNSLRGGTPISGLIAQRLPNSLSLVGASVVIIVIAAVPLGVLGAVKKGTFIDTATQVIAVLGQAIPVFWLGILLVQVFSVNLGLLPSGGTGGIEHYVLPATSLALFVIAGVARLLRSSLLDALDSDYVKFARTKGLSGRIVIGKHALRNALIPVVTFGAMYVSILITLAVVTEVVFAWPGMGRLLYDAVVYRDFPVVQAVILVAGAIIMFANVVVDVTYAYLDPRIRYS